MRYPTISFPATAQPRASVIVLAWRKAGMLANCLTALSRQGPRTPAFECIVVLNGATDDVVALVQERVEGARVIESSVNLGFSGGCNLAATRARGEFLVFLNDDAESDPDWLGALVETADAYPAAGAVGSQVIGHDGMVLEAGSLLWSNALISHLGRGGEPGQNHHEFLRAVDYCSAAALLVRRRSWDAVGGFDERYFPGYYEDLDLCVKLSTRGEKVLFQPRARIRHWESASIDRHFKQFVSDRNKAKFQAKWEPLLRAKPPVPETEDSVHRAAEAARGLHLRALVVDDGSQVALRSTAELVTAGYAASLLAWPGAPDRGAVLADLGVEKIDDVLGSHLAQATVFYDVVVACGGAVRGGVADAVRRHQPQAALVLVDPSAGIAGIPGASDPTATDPDLIVCASPARAARLSSRAGGPPVALLDYRTPVAVPTQAPPASRGGILVVGDAGDRLDWFLTAVAPSVRARAPGAPMRVAGGATGATLSPARGRLVDLLVPPSGIAGAAATAHVVVALSLDPGVDGEGLIRSGTPVMASSAALDDLPGHLRAAVAVEDDAQAFTDRLLSLYTDPLAREAAVAATAEALELPVPDTMADWATAMREAREDRAAARHRHPVGAES